MYTYKQTHKQALVHIKKEMRQNDRPDGSGNLSNYYPTGNKIEKIQSHNLLNVLSNLFLSKENWFIPVKVSRSQNKIVMPKLLPNYG